MTDDPFPDLKIDSSDFLDELQGRSQCPKCQKSRKYYCYTCYVPVPALEGKLPKVKLPIKVDIIKHPGEVDGKSTAAHAAVLASDDVTVYTYPSIPAYSETDRVVLVFPCEESLTIEQYAEQCCNEGISQPGGDVGTTEVDTSQPGGDVRTTEVDTSQPGGDVRTTEVDTSQPVGNVGTTEVDEDSRTHDKCDPGDFKHQASGSADIATQSESTEILKQELPECSSVARGDHPQAKIQDSMKRKSPDTDDEHVGKKLKPTRMPVKGLQRVVFIDSTWFQVRKIYMDERLRNLKKVELKTQTTKFWRPQGNKPNTYLATIEAIYYFLREYHINFVDKDYHGQYDNLLFLFSHLYRKVQQAEIDDPTKKKKRKMLEIGQRTENL